MSSHSSQRAQQSFAQPATGSFEPLQHPQQPNAQYTPVNQFPQQPPYAHPDTTAHPQGQHAQYMPNNQFPSPASYAQPGLAAQPEALGAQQVQPQWHHNGSMPDPGFHGQPMPPLDQQAWSPGGGPLRTGEEQGYAHLPVSSSEESDSEGEEEDSSGEEEESSEEEDDDEDHGGVSDDAMGHEGFPTHQAPHTGPNAGWGVPPRTGYAETYPHAAHPPPPCSQATGRSRVSSQAPGGARSLGERHAGAPNASHYTQGPSRGFPSAASMNQAPDAVRYEQPPPFQHSACQQPPHEHPPYQEPPYQQHPPPVGRSNVSSPGRSRKSGTSSNQTPTSTASVPSVVSPQPKVRRFDQPVPFPPDLVVDDWLDGHRPAGADDAATQKTGLPDVASLQLGESPLEDDWQRSTYRPIPPAREPSKASRHSRSHHSKSRRSNKSYLCGSEGSQSCQSAHLRAQKDSQQRTSRDFPKGEADAYYDEAQSFVTPHGDHPPHIGRPDTHSNHPPGYRHPQQQRPPQPHHAHDQYEGAHHDTRPSQHTELYHSLKPGKLNTLKAARKALKGDPRYAGGTPERYEMCRRIDKYFNEGFIGKFGTPVAVPKSERYYWRAEMDRLAGVLGLDGGSLRGSRDMGRGGASPTGSNSRDSRYSYGSGSGSSRPGPVREPGPVGAPGPVGERKHTRNADCWCLHAPRSCDHSGHPRRLQVCESKRCRGH